MSSNLDNFSLFIKTEVQERCNPEVGVPLLLEEAFTQIVSGFLIEHNEIDDCTYASYRTNSSGSIPASRFSGWNGSGDGATLDLFITKYNNDDIIHIVSRAELESEFKLVRNFLKKCLDGLSMHLEPVHSVYEAASWIYSKKDTLTTVRLFFLTDGIVKSAAIEQEQLEGLDISYVYWDIEKLSRLKVGDREIIELDFKTKYGGSITCLENVDSTNEYKTYLAFIKAPVLSKIYGDYGQRLLEKNVRAFLQIKGKVNKGLQQTLKNEPNRFLAYNNGLCCTAASVTIERNKDGNLYISCAKDFQIVNGGQTTASVFHALKKEKIDINDVVIQLKLTVLNDPNKIAQIVPLISKYANSQNKINTADFSANDPFHQQLESLSRMEWAPAIDGLSLGSHWYYERARGSYLDDKSRAGTSQQIKKWELENPINQKFTKTDLAKFEQTWKKNPHKVSLGAEKNFTSWTLDRSEDGPTEATKSYFQHLIAKAILFKATEKIVSGLNFGGYRANIVTYTLAWLSQYTNNTLDLDKIWLKQSISESLTNAIREIAKKANENIQSSTRTKQNVTEWCKQEDCWDLFKATTINVPDISKDVINTENRIKKIASGTIPLGLTDSSDKLLTEDLINAVKRVDVIGWESLAKWGIETSRLKSFQTQLAKGIASKLSRGSVPSRKESKEALSLLRDAESKGFKYQQ